MNTVLSVQVSLLNMSNLPVIPSPTTHRRPDALLGFFFASVLPDHVVVAACFQASASFGLRQSLAGSPQRSAESSSLALRTKRSPPVALHPASRRRSYLRLRCARTPRQGLPPCGFDAITGALGCVPKTHHPHSGAGSTLTAPDVSDRPRLAGRNEANLGISGRKP